MSPSASDKTVLRDGGGEVYPSKRTTRSRGVRVAATSTSTGKRGAAEHGTKDWGGAQRKLWTSPRKKGGKKKVGVSGLIKARKNDKVQPKVPTPAGVSPGAETAAAPEGVVQEDTTQPKKRQRIGFGADRLGGEVLEEEGAGGHREELQGGRGRFGGQNAVTLGAAEESTSRMGQPNRGGTEGSVSGRGGTTQSLLGRVEQVIHGTGGEVGEGPEGSSGAAPTAEAAPGPNSRSVAAAASATASGASGQENSENRLATDGMTLTSVEGGGNSKGQSTSSMSRSGSSTGKSLGKLSLASSKGKILELSKNKKICAVSTSALNVAWASNEFQRVKYLNKKLLEPGHPSAFLDNAEYQMGLKTEEQRRACRPEVRALLKKKFNAMRDYFVQNVKEAVMMMRKWWCIFVRCKPS